jgi:hypothetical protein
MVLVVQVMQEDEELYDCFVEGLTFYQVILPPF